MNQQWHLAQQMDRHVLHGQSWAFRDLVQCSRGRGHPFSALGVPQQDESTTCGKSSSTLVAPRRARSRSPSLVAQGAERFRRGDEKRGSSGAMDPMAHATVEQGFLRVSVDSNELLRGVARSADLVVLGSPDFHAPLVDLRLVTKGTVLPAVLRTGVASERGPALGSSVFGVCARAGPDVLSFLPSFRNEHDQVFSTDIQEMLAGREFQACHKHGRLVRPPFLRLAVDQERYLGEQTVFLRLGERDQLEPAGFDNAAFSGKQDSRGT